MEQHIYIHRRLESLSRALEGASEFLVKLRRATERREYYSYRLTFEVASGQVWDCGEIVLAPIRTAPEVLKPLLPSDKPSEKILSLWTDLVIRLPDSATSYERTQLQIVISKFLDLIPSNTAIRSTGDRIIALDAPSPESLQAQIRGTTIPGIGIPYSPQVLEISPTLPSDSGREGEEHLPPIPPHPLKWRRELVRTFKLQGLPYKDIARGVGYEIHVVKKDLEWLRKRKLLPRTIVKS